MMQSVHAVMDPAEDVAQIQDLSQAIHEARLERDAEVQSAKDRVDRAYIYIFGLI